MSGTNVNGSPPLNVRIESVKLYSKNTLIAFVDFTLLDVGLTIKGSTVHEKEGKRWIGMPAREYQTNEGKAWAPIVEFADKESRYVLNDSVLAAFEEFHGPQPSQDSAPSEEPW